MIIKIITCHDVFNYGASLQAYALMSYLQSLGYDVQIIDYKPNYLSHHYEFGYVPPKHRFYKRCNSSKLFWFLYGVRLLPITYSTWRRIKPFKDFKKNVLRCTKTYHAYEELVNNPPQADVYIAGSDQIWNCDMPNGHDPSFYLKFGKQNVKRVSYAASFGMSYVPKDNYNAVKNNLSNIDIISCRESTGLDIINSMGFSGCVVPDPVFLLSSDLWRCFCGHERIVKFPYILVYRLDSNNKNLDDAARSLSKEKGIDIIALNNFSKVHYANKNVTSAGPREFVNIICNAEYVVTDSFHASAFSVILNTSFSTYYFKNAASRISCMLEYFKLGHCLNPQTPITSHDWDYVNNRLKEYSSIGQSFLSTIF